MYRRDGLILDRTKEVLTPITSWEDIETAIKETTYDLCRELEQTFMMYVDTSKVAGCAKDVINKNKTVFSFEQFSELAKSKRCTFVVTLH